MRWPGGTIAAVAVIAVAAAGWCVVVGGATVVSAPPPPCEVAVTKEPGLEGDVQLTVRRCKRLVQRIELRVLPGGWIYNGGGPFIAGRAGSTQPAMRRPRRYLVEARIHPALRPSEVFGWRSLYASGDRLHVRVDAGRGVYGVWLQLPVLVK